MSAVKYTRDHEWIRIEGQTAVIGITDYAQGQLGDVVYVELPEIGRKIEKGKEAAVVESVAVPVRATVLPNGLAGAPLMVPLGSSSSTITVEPLLNVDSLLTLSTPTRRYW